MGTNNKERRNAKRSAKARARRRAATNTPRGAGSTGPSWSTGGPGTQRIDEMVAALVDRDAHARCCERTQGTGHVAELAAAPDVVVANYLQYRLTCQVVWLLRHGWDPIDVWEVARRRASALSASITAALLPGAAGDAGDAGDADRAAGWNADCTVFEDADALDPASPDWPALRAAAVELVGVLDHLGALSRLDFVPTHPATPEDAQQASLLARIKRLLAKAESTEFAEEADSFTAKATELMLRHRIDRAALEVTAGPAEGRQVVARRCWIEPPYFEHKSLLFHVVAEANNCRTVRHEYGFTTLVGHVEDIDLAELLFASLLVQATRQMTAAGVSTHEAEAVARAKAQDTYAWLEQTGQLSAGTTEESIRRDIEQSVVRHLERERRKPSFRRSFLVAYATRIDQRLEEIGRETTAAAEAEIGACFLPVLARQQQEVDDAVTELFGDLVTSKVRTTNYAGWVAGSAAAELADLNVRDELGAR